MGGTAPRVKAAVQEAMGGCLFLDEAYALMDSAAGVGGAGDAFSQEALRSDSWKRISPKCSSWSLCPSLSWFGMLEKTHETWHMCTTSVSGAVSAQKW